MIRQQPDLRPAYTLEITPEMDHTGRVCGIFAWAMIMLVQHVFELMRFSYFTRLVAVANHASWYHKAHAPCRSFAVGVSEAMP